MKRPAADGHTQLTMTGVEFLRKLASLVPSPKHNITRYHDVLAPNSKLHAKVMRTQNAPQHFFMRRIHLVQPGDLHFGNGNDAVPKGVIVFLSACRWVRRGRRGRRGIDRQNKLSVSTPRLNKPQRRKFKKCQLPSGNVLPCARARSPSK